MGGMKPPQSGQRAAGLIVQALVGDFLHKRGN
jgi:hypothetical protein